MKSNPQQRKTFWHLLMVLVVGFSVYANIFDAPFVFDDQDSINDNPIIMDFSYFSNPDKAIGLPLYHGLKMRPLGYLSFAINYYFGGTNVFGYHVVNLAIHLISAVLVYCFVRLTFKTPFFDKSDAAEKASLIALLTSMLFVVHPIQTQAVTYIVQRLASLATLLFLLAAVSYVKARLVWLASTNPSARLRSMTFFILALLACIMAMNVKEIAFTLPVILVLYEVLFLPAKLRLKLAFLTPFLMTMAIIPAKLLSFKPLLGAVTAEVSKATVAAQAPINRWDYLYTQFSVIITYLRLIFFPAGQNLDHDFPVYSSFFEVTPLLSFCVLSILFGLGVSCCVGSQSLTLNRITTRASIVSLSEKRLIGFGILWFFITVSVESSIIPIRDVINEHRVYLPSVGIFMACVTLLVGLARKYAIQHWRQWVSGAAVIIVLALGVATLMRNEVWGSQVDLWRDAMQKSPGKVRPYNNLGAALMEKNRPEEAIMVLNQAIKIKPDHPEAFYNLGRAYLIFHKDYQTAIRLFQRAIQLKPDYFDAYVNLGGALNATGQFKEAIPVLTRILQDFRGQRPDANFNLAVAYFGVGRVLEAERQLAIVRRLDHQMGYRLEQYFNQVRSR